MLRSVVTSSRPVIIIVIIPPGVPRTPSPGINVMRARAHGAARDFLVSPVPRSGTKIN